MTTQAERIADTAREVAELEEWLKANPRPDLPYAPRVWQSPRDYYRNAETTVSLICHYCSATPAHHIETELDPVCAECASVWDRKEQQDDETK
jgi:hypothetical protein